MEQASVISFERTVGLDLGNRACAYCVLDARGKLVTEGAFPTARLDLERVFGSMPRTRIVMEATHNTHWMSKALRAFGHEVIVANPRRLDLITKSLRKTDKNDARLLAQLGQCNLELLSPVHERSDASMKVRVLLRARALLVRTRTRLVNHVRASVKIFGGALPSCAPEYFHLKVRQAIPGLLQCALDPLFDQLEALQKGITGYDQQVSRLCEETPATTLFREIHGVGPLIAISFVTCIEDPHRFKNSRSIGAYFGLVPGSRQSGEKDPRLPITKHGEGSMRSLLVSAAMHVMRRSAPDCELKRYGRRIAASGTPRDKGRARVAVARKLACLMHRLWLTGEVYRPLRCKTEQY